MNIFLWILQAALAALFALSGLGKAFQPKEKVLVKAPALEGYAPPAIRFIGATELAGAIGLVLPATFGIATVLTPTAGIGLAVLMLLGAVLHLRRREGLGVGVTIALCVLAAVVSWGRFGPYSF